MTRVVSLGLMIALLVTALHVVMDHGVSGQVVFFSHTCPPHLGDVDHAAAGQQQADEDGVAGGHDAGHRHADTHHHCTWSPPLETSSIWHLAVSPLHAGALGIVPPPGLSALPVLLCASPPRHVSLYLRCHALLI